MFANNGIAKAKKNDTFYVASTPKGTLSILERQADNTLVLTDEISTGKEGEGYGFRYIKQIVPRPYHR